jgi:signal transduction histidine kinase
VAVLSLWERQLDFVLFLVISIGAGVVLAIWLRSIHTSRHLPAYVWIVHLLLAVGAGFLADNLKNSQHRHMRGLVEGFAPTYARELEILGHSRITLETAPDDPLYLAMIEAEKRWLSVNSSVADIYTFRKMPDGRIVLVVDSETDYDRNGRYEGDREQRTPIGEVYESDLGPRFDAAWEGRPAFDDRIVHDRWGSWISAYHPVRDASGRVEAVLGVDYPAEAWVVATGRARLTAFLIILGIQSLWLGTTTAIALLRAEVRIRRKAEAELAAHQADLERLVSENTQELLAAQKQLLQNEKLACVGQLASGVAHEINTPIQYIGDNLKALSDEFNDLIQMEEEYRELVAAVKAGLDPLGAVERIEAAEKEHDIGYILEDAPKAIAQSLEGVGKVAQIVRAMKKFAHGDQGEMSEANLNDVLQTTLTVARNEYKYHADVQTQFGEIPAVQCYASEMGQVFLNLVVNATHAIADTGKRGLITVTTLHDGGEVEIRIRDTGTGIPEHVRPRIFDPFFTTKPVGKGTGQGLSIVQQIVVQKHHGKVAFESTLGEGTEFIVRLPIVAARDDGQRE